MLVILVKPIEAVGRWVSTRNRETPAITRRFSSKYLVTQWAMIHRKLFSLAGCHAIGGRILVTVIEKYMANRPYILVHMDP